MRQADIYQKEVLAGCLEEIDTGRYRFTYTDHYSGDPVSLAMPTSRNIYEFEEFPPLFEGLLPEGQALEALLRLYKLDRRDYFGQLLLVGKDVVGSLRVEERK